MHVITCGIIVTLLSRDIFTVDDSFVGPTISLSVFERDDFLRRDAFGEVTGAKSDRLWTCLNGPPVNIEQELIKEREYLSVCN